MVGVEREGGQEREHNTTGLGRKLVVKWDQSYEEQAVNAVMLHFVWSVMSEYPSYWTSALNKEQLTLHRGFMFKIFGQIVGGVSF